MEWAKESSNSDAPRHGATGHMETSRCQENRVQAEVYRLRVRELEQENSRLTRLVADLLLKNQRLRDCQ